jgi:DNA-binding MarR family transcriptional regulator
MVAPVAKYLFQNYCTLYTSFGYEAFDFQAAIKVLNLDESYTGQILSKLENDGWISKRQGIADARKKSYRLNDIEKIIGKIGKKGRDKK